jgi:GNAT superfamily N-acetyltransferase
MRVDLSFVSEVPDRQNFEALLFDYYSSILKVLDQANGPALRAEDMVSGAMDYVHEMLPPNGRLAMATGEGNRMLGCGAIRAIRPEAVELKWVFVRPECQGQGLGRKICEMMISEARRMGHEAVYADTVKGNQSMLAVFEKTGFEYIPRYAENANPVDLEPYLVFLRRRLVENYPPARWIRRSLMSCLCGFGRARRFHGFDGR